MLYDTRFDWDDSNEWKIEERYDIEDVQEVFYDRFRQRGPSYNMGSEQRRATFGSPDEYRVISVVYTMRGDKIRPISA